MSKDELKADISQSEYDALKDTIYSLTSEVSELKSKMDSKANKDDLPWVGAHQDSVNADKMIDEFLNENN